MINIRKQSFISFTDDGKNVLSPKFTLTMYQNFSPEISMFKGTTIIENDTEIQPENMEIMYKSRR